MTRRWSCESTVRSFSNGRTDFTANSVATAAARLKLSDLFFDCLCVGLHHLPSAFFILKSIHYLRLAFVYPSFVHLASAFPGFGPSDITASFAVTDRRCDFGRSSCLACFIRSIPCSLSFKDGVSVIVDPDRSSFRPTIFTSRQAVSPNNDPPLESPCCLPPYQALPVESGLQPFWQLPPPPHPAYSFLRLLAAFQRISAALLILVLTVVTHHGKTLSQFQMALLHKDSRTLTKDRINKSTNTSRRNEGIIKHEPAQRRNYHKNNKQAPDGSRTSNDRLEPCNRFVSI